MANDEILRLRATVVSDEALAQLRLMGREIGLVQSKGGAGAKAAAGSWAQLGKSVKGVGQELVSAVPMLAGFGLGAAGAGIAARVLIGTLGDISKKIIDMKYASKELGLSQQALKAFATEAQKAGIAPEAMMQGMQNFKRNTEDFSMRIGELRGQMVAMGAGPVLARINAATTQLDKMKEAYDFKEVLMESDPSGMKARRFFEMIGLGADAARLSWDEFAATMKEKKPLTPEQIKAAEDFNKALITMGEKWEELSTKVGIKLFPQITQMMNEVLDLIDKLEKMNAGGEKGKKAANDLLGSQPFGSSFDFLNLTPKEAWGKISKPGSFSPGVGSLLPGAVPDPDAAEKSVVGRAWDWMTGANKPAPGPGRAVGGPVSRGVRYTVGERGPEQFTPSMSGMIRPAGGGTDESTQSRIIKVGVFDALVEFKSYIETSEQAGGGGKGGFMRASLGGGGGGGGGGGDGPTGMLGDTSVGPYGGVGGGSGGQSNPRPGPGGQGGGGTAGPSGVTGDSSGQNQPGSGGQQASRPGPGGQSGGPSGAKAPDGAPAGATSGTIPGKFSEQITGMMAQGMQPKNISDWLKTKGVDVSVATCGQFMAAKVKEAGGTPPTGAAVASNWNTFGGKTGAGYSDDPNAINIAVKQGVRTGQTGAHVTAAIPIKDKDGKIVGWSGVGVNQGFGQGNAKVAGKGDYGRDVLTAVPLTIGTGRGQYQIRHQIVDPKDRPQGTETAQTPNGQAPQGTQAPQAAAPTPNGQSATTPEGSATLAAQRKPYMDYLNANPELKAKMAALLVSEEPSPEGRTGTAETLFNRMISHGIPPEKMASTVEGLKSGPGAYYEPLRPGGTFGKSQQRLADDPKLLEQTNAAIDRAGAGSNVSNYGTQNASAGVAASAARTSTVTREAIPNVSDQWSRKDNPDFASLHGPGTVKKERQWYERTAAAVTAENNARDQARSVAKATPNEAWGKDQRPVPHLTDTQRIDAQVAPASASGQVNVTVNSNGTKATADAKTDGKLFQDASIRQHRQMQRTEDAGATAAA